jgi:hypothetical protein
MRGYFDGFVIRTPAPRRATPRVREMQSLRLAGMLIGEKIPDHSRSFDMP